MLKWLFIIAYALPSGEPLLSGAGNRVYLLIEAGELMVMWVRKPVVRLKVRVFSQIFELLMEVRSRGSGERLAREKICEEKRMEI